MMKKILSSVLLINTWWPEQAQGLDEDPVVSVAMVPRGLEGTRWMPTTLPLVTCNMDPSQKEFVTSAMLREIKCAVAVVVWCLWIGVQCVYLWRS